MAAPFAITVHMTPDQFAQINGRSGLAAFDGKARGEYLLGCALGEPEDALRLRVQQIAAEDRARLRTELLSSSSEASSRV